MSAVITPCGRYRLRLDREITPLGLAAALIGVNPSTADATNNDATIRKDIGFALRQGWRRIIKANLCAYRATDVRELAACDDPIGPGNDEMLEAIMREADVVVACWGPTAKLPRTLRARWQEVAAIADRLRVTLMCFGTAQDGQPRHTLMIPYETPLVPWIRPDWKALL